MKHVKSYLVILGILLMLALSAVMDNGLRGGAGFDRLKHDLKELAPLMVSADVAVNNSARYIRHRSLTYPGSAFPDFPGQRDYLPAGMAWSATDFPGVETRLHIDGPSQRDLKGNP
ncbi:MAG: hypothetical protein WDA72_01965 [Desulfomonilia bacterium]|jgi:hypothetical protein|nr:hypothetical protein [Deltaproteobacteria bacterium]MDX9761280.1 hypothetical protein [Desulfomonilia bacterium]